MKRDDDGRDTLVDRKTRLGVGGDKVTPEADLVGRVIGGYLVEAELGAGGMGAVYRASHIDTNRVVALKSLHPHLMSEPVVVARFKREAKLAARLGHPHVAGVIEVVEVGDGRLAMVMELVEGEPLTAIMTMPLPPERVTLLAGQLLRGLEHAHGMGLVHRDLKPDNVIVETRNARDHVHIVDFGIAILRDGSESQERLTATGQMIGTPLYMAPEQATGDIPDHRADLFSLGVMVYEMLAGVLPFTGRPLDILTQTLKRDPPPIAERVPGLLIEPLLEAFARKLMQRDVAKRFQSARHALDTLELVLKDPANAGPALGVMDVEKALAVVSLPPPPSLPRGPFRR